MSDEADKAEIQKWIEYAEHPLKFERPVLNNSLLVGTINNILKHNNQPLIELHEIYDPSAKQIETSTEHFKSVLKKIKIPKITKIKNVREKLDKEFSELIKIRGDRDTNEYFDKLNDELAEFTQKSFPQIHITYEYEDKLIKPSYELVRTHGFNFTFRFRNGTIHYELRSKNFNNLVAGIFRDDRIIHQFRTMLNTYEFFQFRYSDTYMKFGHTIFVYVNNKDKHIIGDFDFNKRTYDIQLELLEAIQEGTLEYNIEKNNSSHSQYSAALFELIFAKIITRNFGYTGKKMPTVQEGPVCTFWMFFRMVFHDLTREQLIEKLEEAADTIGLEPITESIEAIMVVMVREMLHNPEIKQQENIADSKTGFGLNKKNKKTK